MFSEEQIRRYSRHIILPEVGGKGQKRLLSASCLIIGAGGLGSPSGYYLAAAGVGRLGFCDFDVVDISNLQRQILHNTDRIGKNKAESARETIERLNPDVKVEIFSEKLCKDNIMGIMKDFDLVLDGSDNFPTRYLVNDACVMLKKTNISASVFRFSGQLTVFSEDGPCYRCLYSEPPPKDLVPSCQEAGVLGVLPGVLGLLQATEAVKIILDIGEPLIGRLLVFDGLRSEFSEYRIRKDPDCPICGESPTIKELTEYEEVCDIREML
jgi:adenylyltransferase/sulfurtransferase